MKKLTFALLLVAALMLIPAGGSAHEYDRDDSDYPVRYVGYVLHPVGVAVEYIVLRPIHWLVSKPHFRIIFGHQPVEEPDHDYFAWE